MEKYPKLPFDCTVMDKEPVEVANPYSGEKATLTPQAVAAVSYTHLTLPTRIRV